MIDEQQRPRLVPSVRLQTARATGEPVLLYPEGILELNETSREIALYCDGQRSVNEIIVALAGQYECPVEELREDVIHCLEELHRRKLIGFAP